MREAILESSAERYPLLMESVGTNRNQMHVIDMGRPSDDSSSGLSLNNPSGDLAPSHNEDRQRGNIEVLFSLSSASNGLNSRSSSITRREEHSGSRFWSPFNIIFWLSIDVIFTLAQIISAIIVLSISRNEKPKAPLFAWVVGYAAGCAISLPITFWRYLNRTLTAEQEPSRFHQDSNRLRSNSESNSSITLSLTRTTEEEDGQNSSANPQNSQAIGVRNARISLLVNRLKIALDCFFAVWFIMGNVWVFGGHSSVSDAPNLYRLCLVFLTISCIGYAMPLILCSLICCCLPCIISIVGVHEDKNQMRGATEETINALPVHKFKLKQKADQGGDSSSGVDEGGFVAVGTEKERLILGEDAVCCICLESYEDNEELRELPCSHFFHKECADTWLKINATCPLCKFEIGGRNANSPSENAVEQV